MTKKTLKIALGLLVGGSLIKKNIARSKGQYYMSLSYQEDNYKESTPLFYCDNSKTKQYLEEVVEYYAKNNNKAVGLKINSMGFQQEAISSYSEYQDDDEKCQIKVDSPTKEQPQCINGIKFNTYSKLANDLIKNYEQGKNKNNVDN